MARGKLEGFNRRTKKAKYEKTAVKLQELLLFSYSIFPGRCVRTILESSGCSRKSNHQILSENIYENIIYGICEVNMEMPFIHTRSV